MDSIKKLMSYANSLDSEEEFLNNAGGALKNFDFASISWKSLIQNKLESLTEIDYNSKSTKEESSFWINVNNHRVPLAGGSLDDQFGSDYSLDYMIVGLQSIDYTGAGFFRFDLSSGSEVASSINSQVMLVVEGECHYTEYRLSTHVPSIIDSPSAVSNLKIIGSEQKVAKRGDIIVRDRTSALTIIDTSVRCVLLTLTAIKYTSLFQFNFETKSGNVKKIIDNDITSSRKRKLLNVLQTYGNRESLPIIKKLISDPHHGIRWQALKALMNIDQKNIEKYLRIGLKDKSSEIRNICEHFLNLDNKEVV